MSRVILNNIQLTIEQVAVFIAEASNKPIKQRRGYYKASLFFTASTVEAFVYLIVKKYCNENRIKYRTENSYKLLHNFPDNLFRDVIGKVGIYEKTEKEFEWEDKIDFQMMNQIGLKYRIFNQRFYKKLDNIREKRNNIHIQSLTQKDLGYSKKDIEYVASAIPKLLDISKKYGVTS